MKLKNYLSEDRTQPKILNELFVQFNELLGAPKGEERDKQILRLAIIAEFDAANLYENMAEQTNDPDVKALLRDIANEEKTHIGEFEYLLGIIDEDHEQFVDDGEEEAEDIVDEQ